MSDPLSQEEMTAFMDGLTAYLSSEAPEPERLATALAIAKGKLTEESIAPEPKREPATEKELIDEISDIQKIFADQPQKQEFTINIITEIITPVTVEATCLEEAEHLALEQFKLAAGEHGIDPLEESSHD
ncbi:hypothetical protein [Microcoleus sp. FACHB-672]|uniref:hypothetical protein n=1 Tax=Microcoleus sp. FACHB-672 TaxID=2692825 RepID=UPI0016880A6E|nr:hypothetical protein [Microcoleus sp. FACHB-672]MBD2039696.1 hypothetical protein [Microcoleus sp. FACHB-672]